ncbi:hypothetical protein Tco_1560800, partial [Tanacetum coccineum]
SSNLDHFNDPSLSRPPLEPPDVEICFDFDPDTGVVTTKVVKGIFNEVQSERLLSRDEFSISFIHDPLSLVFDTLLPFLSENEDKVFNPVDSQLVDGIVDILLAQTGEGIAKCEFLKWFVNEDVFLVTRKNYTPSTVEKSSAVSPGKTEAGVSTLKVRIYHKSQENSQKRANPNTRNGKVNESRKPKQEKVNLQSNWSNFGQQKPNGDALRKFILKGPYTPTIITSPVVPATKNSLAVLEQTTVETVMNMTPENRAYFESKKEMIHLILTRIGDEIYSTVDACQTAQEM